MPILVLRNNEQFGPFELNELTRYVQAGNFLANDYCWQERWELWRLLDSIVSLPAPVPITSRATPRQSILSSSASSPRLSRKTIFVLGILIFFYFSSPYRTLYRLKRAVERNDAVIVANRIDFPKFRESFKGRVMANLAKKAANGEADGFEALGAAFGALMVGPMVDSFVTPEGLIQMMQGRDTGSIMEDEKETTKAGSPKLCAEIFAERAKKGWMFQVVEAAFGVGSKNPIHFPLFN